MEHTVTLQIDPHWVETFKNKLRLCVAFGVHARDTTDHSVVAFAADVKPTITVSWKDSFQIAASNGPFNAGGQITNSTTRQDINFGNTYILPRDWTDKRPVGDPSAPKNGFSFKTDVDESAPILYKRIQGVPTPIWIADNPGENRDISPTGDLKIWFANEQQGTMIRDPRQGDELLVDTTGQRNISARYDSSGSWRMG